MDRDIAILHKAEKLDHLDLESYVDKLDPATAEEVSDAADRVIVRYHALMKNMPVLARVAMASAPAHPVEASVAKSALMLSLIEEQTRTRVNYEVTLQSAYDNVTDMLGDSHFFEILDQTAEACALAIYVTTAGWALSKDRRSNFELPNHVPHAGVVQQLLKDHDYDEHEAVMLSRHDNRNDHDGMLRMILGL